MQSPLKCIAIETQKTDAILRLRCSFRWWSLAVTTVDHILFIWDTKKVQYGVENPRDWVLFLPNIWTINCFVYFLYTYSKRINRKKHLWVFSQFFGDFKESWHLKMKPVQDKSFDFHGGLWNIILIKISRGKHVLRSFLIRFLRHWPIKILVNNFTWKTWSFLFEISSKVISIKTSSEYICAHDSTVTPQV